MDESRLIAAALGGMALLLFLIMRVKLHAFVALLLGSLVIGAGAGMPVADILSSVTTGVGSTLGSIAVVIGLGAMFGQMLEVSGGAERLAASLVARFGESRAQWSLLLAGFIVAVPVFFDVAFVILVSVVYGLTEKSGRSIVYYALPLLAGLAVTHAFIPPTPGPVAVASLLGADLGWVVLLGAAIGFPAAAIAGPMYARWISPRIVAAVPDYMHAERSEPTASPPSLGTVVALIGLPLALIVAGTLADAWLPAGAMRGVLTFAGHPMVALLIATLLCFWLLGVRRGYSREEVSTIATRALEPAGIVILVTGAGGVLKQVLIDSGAGELLADRLAASALPPLVLAFAIAAVVRIMQGSATVAMLTAAGLVASLLAEAEFSPPMLALLVIAIAAGATTVSHVNDSGFWLVNRYLGLGVGDTLRTWTVTTTLISIVALALILIAGLFV